MTITELARQEGQSLEDLPASTLSELAYDAIIAGDADAAEVTAMAVRAYEREQA